MAYATGSGAGINDLLDAIQSFAAGQGWTIARWDTVQRILMLNKGQCNVVLKAYQRANYNTYVWGVASSAATVITGEWTLRGTLCTAFNLASNDVTSHTGVPIVTATNDADLVQVPHLNGPYTAWHLFSDATGSYIHVVVQIGALDYIHLAFGNVDKRGLTHSGAGYLTASCHTAYKMVNAADTSVSIFNNKTHLVAVPFAGGNLQGAYVGSNGSIAQAHVPDAIPVVYPHNVINSQQANSGCRLAPCFYSDDGSNWPATNGNLHSLLDSVAAAPASNWAGYAAMYALPMLMSVQEGNISAGTNAIVYVGDYPDVRLINITGFSPGQEFTLSTDTWVVFPIFRQTGWDQQNGPGPTTFQFGLAYRKVP
jgi:hypothetical protein